MTEKFINRWVWVYASINPEDLTINVNTFVSPDHDAPKLDNRDTPYNYTLTRNSVRYHMMSEVQLSQVLAIRIAGTMYDSEFVINPQIHYRMPAVNR